MSRIRSIKPEFWQDELIASWPPLSRLAYIALWNEADDEGRLRASMPYLRSRLFPYEENLDVFGIIMPIVTSGRLVLYEVDGQSYGLLPNFNKHQVINKPTRSKFPPLPDDSRSAPVVLPVGREGKGREKSTVLAMADDESLEGKGTPPTPLQIGRASA